MSDQSGSDDGSVQPVEGQLCWEVWVDCPQCQHHFDAQAQDTGNEYTLAGAVFGKIYEPANWADPGVELLCPKCAREFTLTKIVY